MKKSYNGNVNNQLKVAKYFLEHIQLRKKIKENKENQKTNQEVWTM